ncbi:MAG: hypothetical protein J7497_06910, partial [Chitinophagaceae bacterium]|nr:hypothetical protein [Chitinophagaceae bacterium]
YKPGIYPISLSQTLINIYKMKNIFILMLLALGAQNINAQQRGVAFSVSYPVSFPMGDLSDYINKTSFRGINMEITKRQMPNWDFGLESGWNVFYAREDSKEYKEQTVTITGVQYRYTNAVPIIAEAKYYFETSSGKSKPYVGGGLGTTYISRATDFGLYRITNNTWQFCLRPEIGFKFEDKYGRGIFLGARYYANFANDELDAQSYLSINLGFSFGHY